MNKAKPTDGSTLEEASARPRLWIAERAVQALRWRFLVASPVILALFFGTLSVTLGMLFGFITFRDAGYPDSATLLRVGEFIHTGHLYPAFDRPPYLVTLYGPLTYLLLAIPSGLAKAAGISPVVPVRFTIASAFVLNAWLIFFISKRLYGVRGLAWISFFFAVSPLPLADWVTQVRCDFLGLGFALLSICLALAGAEESMPVLVGGAVCAGLALLVKQTFVAAPLAIVAWLLYRRLFQQAVVWSACFVLTAAGGYTIAWWREPMMLSHLRAIRQPVFEFHEALDIVQTAVSQPVTLFFVLGAVLAILKPTPGRLLLATYATAAWLVGFLTIGQVGGNVNYFWEALLASAVLAGAGLYELQQKTRTSPILVTLLLFILLAYTFVPLLHADGSYLKASYGRFKEYASDRRRWEAFVSVVAGKRILSTFPDLTIRSSIPEIPDPYLNAMLERRGQWKPTLVLAALDADTYDVVIIGPYDKIGWRHLTVWDNAMWDSLKANYSLGCVFHEMEVWLPRRGSSDLLRRLSASGCETPTRPSFVQ